MNKSLLWSIAAGVLTFVGAVCGWKASSENRKEVEADKEYFSAIASRIEDGMKGDNE